MSDRSVRGMLDMEWHLYPFRIQMMQEILPHDLNIAEGLLHQVVGNDGHTTTISSNLDNIR
jgi:hypothetical protein